MSAFVTLDALSVTTPDGRRLFDGLTLAFGRERTGIVGRNGCGKSTLLRLIAGGVEPARGSVLRSGSIGMLDQAQDESLTVGEALGVADESARLKRLEHGDGSADDAADADWTLETRLEAALADAGLPALALDRTLATMSGGERTRLALARLLFEAPDVLLLDEPTNNLDADGREAVAQLLARWRGGVILASHDRALLERVDRVVELTPVSVTVFGGGWSSFVAMRDAARARAETDVERAADALRATERAAQQAREKKARRDKAGRASRADGYGKMFLNAQRQRAEDSGAREGYVADRLLGARQETLEEARARLEVLTPLAIDLPRTGLAASRILLALHEVGVAHAVRRLFDALSFEVRGPERIAIRGANGSGKTTLLKLIAGELQPDSGDIRRLTDRIAVLDQHAAALDPMQSVLDNLLRLYPGLADQAARAALARFAFRNAAALQLAGTLSGGEQLRAALACAFAKPEPPLLLLLDEPTNHLDIAAIEVLERALAQFDGALIAVSHDERFLAAIGVQREIAL